MSNLAVDQFKHVTKLETLKLSHNKLQSISELNFGATLTALTDLEIKNNPGIWIGDKTFSQLPKINKVDMSDCDLTTKHISDLAFKNAKITSLSLADNKLLS